MFRHLLFFNSLFLASVLSFSQNDQDALRYSRTGVGGTPRNIAMGGAFGALGADMSCASYNPAGLGLYRKGEFVYSGGLKFNTISSDFLGSKNSSPSADFAFSNFGIAFSYASEKDKTKRNTFAFSNNQLQNFDGSFLITESNSYHSMARDMMNIANEVKVLGQMNPTYELMGYNSYVLDYDSASGKYFSFVDLNRSLSLKRSVTTTGRMNELNISFAQSADDKYYIGGSLGIPRLNFESTTIHSETDSNDSMRVGLTSGSSYTTTYNSYLPFIYTDMLGFNSLKYEEVFSTKGYGLNLKLGAVVRINQSFRVGAYFHSPTIFYLSDNFYYRMEARFDANTTKPMEAQYPDGGGGIYEYRITTPLRFGINGAYIYQKTAAFALDIEQINYGMASLNGETADVFSGVNAVIKDKYKSATNIRAGVEYNLSPILLRAGYNYYGSPFGGFFSGPFDRQTVSFGAGYRTKGSLFFDMAWARTLSKEKYFMYSTVPLKSDLKFVSSSLILSVGLKF